MAREKRRRSEDVPTDTTIVSLSVDLLHQILLRLPSLASVARVAAASRFLRDAVSAQDFRDKYLSLHASSSLLGLFFSSDDDEGSPQFQPVPQAGADRDLAAAVRGADFFLTRLREAPMWRLEDCLGGHLLLSRDKSLAVSTPLSGRAADILFPPQLDSSADAYFACLLGGHGDAASFRVLSVQRRNGDGGGLQAAEYDSSTGRWRFHPWMDVERPEARGRAMHAAAAGLIFWGHDHGQGPLLLLDSITMSFSGLHLPSSIVHLKLSRYSIGETGDGNCCLIAAITDSNLHVWVLSADFKTWEFKANIDVQQAIGMATRVRQVCAVGSGVAFLRRDSRGPLFVVDIKKWCLKTEMEQKGGIIYPFQMPWPVMATTSEPNKKMLLGLFSSDLTFQPTLQARSNPSLCTAITGGDFKLIKFNEGPRWRLQDSFNGVILLSREESLAVYDPISRRCVNLCRPQIDDSHTVYLADCMVQAHGDEVASLRVVSLQHKRRGKLVRAMEYNHGTGPWQPHEWTVMKNPPQELPMHAEGHVFWRCDDTSMLLLDK